MLVFRLGESNQGCVDPTQQNLQHTNENKTEKIAKYRSAASTILLWVVHPFVISLFWCIILQLLKDKDSCHWFCLGCISLLFMRHKLCGSPHHQLHSGQQPTTLLPPSAFLKHSQPARSITTTTTTTTTTTATSYKTTIYLYKSNIYVKLSKKIRPFSAYTLHY